MSNPTDPKPLTAEEERSIRKRDNEYDARYGFNFAAEDRRLLLSALDYWRRRPRELEVEIVNLSSLLAVQRGRISELRAELVYYKAPLEDERLRMIDLIHTHKSFGECDYCYLLTKIRRLLRVRD